MSNISPVQKLKSILSAESVQEQFRNALQENTGIFTASLIDVYNNDKYLQECNPSAVVMEALKAATLKLPINKQLGFAYIVPYKSKGVAQPQFQLGYKGYIQLAMRTGQYRYLNAGCVYEGQIKGFDWLTGRLDLSGEKKSDKIIGYFAYMELLNGFSKVLYWTVDEVRAHAQKYSKSYNSSTSAWQTNFDAMALKTMLRNLLGHYGILSVEMIGALTTDGDAKTPEEEAAEEVATNANMQDLDQDITDVDFSELEPVPEAGPAEGPGF